MEEIKIFENDEFGKIRTLNIDGEPWFVGKDICEAFGDTNYRRSLSVVDKMDKGVSQIKTLGGTQGMTIINESGIYSLLFYMQPQKAKGVSQNVQAINERTEKLHNFKRWVTSVILPSIRKNGGYIQGQETMSDIEILAKSVLVAQRVIEEKDKKIAEQSALISEQKPLVTFALNVSNAEQSMDLGEFAKIVNKKDWNLGRNKLFSWLRGNKIVMENNIPYQKYIDNGYFTCIEVNKSSDYGTKNFIKTLITPKGQVWLTNKLQEYVDDFFNDSKE